MLTQIEFNKGRSAIKRKMNSDDVYFNDPYRVLYGQGGAKNQIGWMLVVADWDDVTVHFLGTTVDEALKYIDRVWIQEDDDDITIGDESEGEYEEEEIKG